MKTVPTSRSETLARDLLKSFFGVDPQAQPRPQHRQPQPADDLLLPLRPDPADSEMLKCYLPVWGRRDPDAPQVRSAAISAKLVKERPRRHKVLWMRKGAPEDWRRDLLKLLDAYETGRLRIFANGIACAQDGWCSFPSARVGTGY